VLRAKTLYHERLASGLSYSLNRTGVKDTISCAL
jgi:hypothetical protein